MANEANCSWNYFLNIGRLIASHLKNKPRFLIPLSTEFVNSGQLLRVEDDGAITICHDELSLNPHSIPESPTLF